MARPPAGTAEYTEHNLNACFDRLLTTADRTVFSHIDLDLQHNVQYDQSQLLDLLAHCAISNEFANGGTKTRRVDGDDVTRLRSDHRSPLAKALGYHLRTLDRPTVREQFDRALEAEHRLAQQVRLFTQPVDVAIDVHDWL